LNAKVGADMKLLTVYSGGAAEQSGLAAGDHLIALDGLKASVETLRVALERRPPGESLRVHAFRRDELSEHVVRLAEPPLDTCFLAFHDKPGEQAIARRVRWLSP
jgi:predicted metalloprotease with PDZ domain